MSSTPRISIGVPAYNSAATIGTAIESLLGQTYRDFEIIVSDNASTDATREIVERFAHQDHRIRYVYQAENIGANLNYSFVAKAARGEYFKWASSSDWYAPRFLESCLQALEQNKDAVLAAPRTRLFTGDLESAINYEHDIEVLETSPAARLKTLSSTLQLNNALNGLIRMDALRRTSMIEPYYRADEVLMGHLAMLGKLLLVDEYLYYRRMEAATATALQDPISWRKHHYPKLSARVLFQAWKRYFGWLRAGLGTPMPVANRLQVLKYLAKMCYWERHSFLIDVQGALRYMVKGGVRE
jgi:glycosyltransferase involved in cell wall biosynthesis